MDIEATRLRIRSKVTTILIAGWRSVPLKSELEISSVICEATTAARVIIVSTYIVF